MILAILALFVSLACFIVCLLTLIVVITIVHGPNPPKEIQTSPNDAILISGCDSGIGLELAKYFYRTTNFTLICSFLDDLSSDGYQQLRDLSDSNGQNRLKFRSLDITSADDIDDTKNFIDNLIKDGLISDLYAVINNAGTLRFGELDWQTSKQITDQIDVNLVGTVRLTQALLPFIVKRQGRVINVSSVNDSIVFPGLSVYSATKGAVSVFSKSLGYELRKFGAHSITIRLGDFAKLTDIMKKHSQHRDDMWNNLGSTKQKLYSRYFDSFHNHILSNFGMTSPQDFDSSSLFKDFRRALLSAKEPPSVITCAPLGYQLLYSVMELSPIWVQYNLLDLLFKYKFNWTNNKL